MTRFNRLMVSFFYVLPSWRGTGIAAEMDAFVTAYFKRRGHKTVRLSVDSPQRTSQAGLFDSVDVTDLGPREDQPKTRNMEKALGNILKFSVRRTTLWSERNVITLLFYFPYP